VNDQPKRVLFVCIGNSCRSQMAEAFARAYGSDIVIPASAGLSASTHIAPHTVRCMQERNLDLHEQFPKSLRHMSRVKFDLVVNMSGMDLPVDPHTRVLDWDVADPVMMSYDEHCQVRDDIERMVMQLILQLRIEGHPEHFRGQGPERGER
jgi:arsenate reductase